MSSNYDGTVIDLTSSFTLPGVPGQSSRSNDVIEIDSEESFEEINRKNRNSARKRGRSSGTNNKRKPKIINDCPICVESANSKCSNFYELAVYIEEKCPSDTKKMKIGDCPICMEELGTNAIGSTRCGHVFCICCLEESLKFEKRCPTCRKTLRGKNAYHPLYMSST